MFSCSKYKSLYFCVFFVLSKCNIARANTVKINSIFFIVSCFLMNKQIKMHPYYINTGANTLLFDAKVGYIVTTFVLSYIAGFTDERKL